MRALVISGGGSKGAFAGGVAQYLIEHEKRNYDILVGTSTGSLMISHLALGKITSLKKLYTSVTQKSIFNSCPFKVTGKGAAKTVKINHLKVLVNFLKKRKTFGESKNLRKLIDANFTEQMYQDLIHSNKDIIVAVSNLTVGVEEYKSIKDCSREQFCDWIWASCNYVPFMSLYEHNFCEYADGGFGALVPIKEAVNRGAKEIDVIILDTEVNLAHNMPSKNPFSLLSNLFEFTLNQVGKQNIALGKLACVHHGVTLNLYYTPTILTTNSLIFDKSLMEKWWEDGYLYAKEKHTMFEMNEIKLNSV